MSSKRKLSGMNEEHPTGAPTPPTPSYPVNFGVEYPDRDLNRVTTFFRIFTAIPILIVLAAVSGGSSFESAHGEQTFAIAAGSGGLLVLPALLMVVFREKYPSWWFDWNRELMRFSARVGVYLALMDDRYPSTDEQQAVRLDFEQPDPKTELNRWLPLVKWFLAIPHYVVLLFLSIGALVAVILAWFAILFTGRYPRALFDFVEGVGRWHNRVATYAFVLVTDRYPPFTLRP